MHKNMQKLYESLGSYFAFDPHTVSMEDFFGDLANFRNLFMVSIVALSPIYPQKSAFFLLLFALLEVEESRIFCSFSNVYKSDFPKESSRAGADNILVNTSNASSTARQNRSGLLDSSMIKFRIALAASITWNMRAQLSF